MPRKQVNCCNCGFLAIRGESISAGESLDDLKLFKELGLLGSQECTQRGRDRIVSGTHADPRILTCTRHVWGDVDIKDKPVDAFFQFLNSGRKCPYFFLYSPGYAPIEHRELQREAKTQRLLIKGMIVAAVIGALIGAVGVIVTQFITR